MGILSEEELYQARREVNAISQNLLNFTENIQKVVDAYMADETAQTFFVSGNFGKSQLDDLNQLKKVLVSFIEAAKNELIPSTLKYVDTQLELVQGNK